MLMGVHVVMGVLVRMNMVMFLLLLLLLLIIAMVVRGDLIMCMAMPRAIPMDVCMRTVGIGLMFVCGGGRRHTGVGCFLY
jgi:hypothetical protein